MSADDLLQTADYTAEEIGIRLESRLAAGGLSVAGLWRRMGEHGSERHLGDIVKGKTKPRPDTLRRCIKALDLTVEDFFSDSPFADEVVVALTEHELDVMYAAGAFDRALLKTVARRAITTYVSEQEQDPDVRKMLDAILAGRARRAAKPAKR
ncbi:MAG: hypothetical protein QOD92_3126 [Acidimicrobiaceae bacterium]